MRVGYVRVSLATPAARLQNQIDQLRGFGVDRVVCEQGDLTRATLLAETIKNLSRNDELVVVHLSAVAADANSFFDILAQLEAKRAKLHVRATGVTYDPLSPVLAGLVREMARAEKEAKTEAAASINAPQSRPPIRRGAKGSAGVHADLVIRLAGEGMTREAIASRIGIGVASVYRILKAAREERTA